jgi:prepilin peptidase CpaA
MAAELIHSTSARPSSSVNESFPCCQTSDTTAARKQAAANNKEAKVRSTSRYYEVLTYPPVVFQVLLVTLVGTAAIFDVRTQRVPNWLTLAGVVLGLALNTFLFELPGLWFSLRGLGIAMLIYFPLYLLRGMGAGDVKLMAAIGAMLGAGNWLAVLVATSVFAAVIGLIVASRKGRISQTFFNLELIVASVKHGQAPYEANPALDVRSERAIRSPHAVSIALGSVVFLIAAHIWAPR